MKEIYVITYGSIYHDDSDELIGFRETEAEAKSFVEKKNAASEVKYSTYMFFVKKLKKV